MYAKPATYLAIVVQAVMCVVPVIGQTPVGTTFSYQGQLSQNGAPMNGTVDLRFRLFDAGTGGAQVATQQVKSNVTVVNGLFRVDLDFGSAAFGGDARWLDVAVRSPAGSGTFTTLTPRQRLNAVPYAMYALSTPGGITDGHSLDAADGAPTDAVFVNNAGLVGIGTTSPIQALDVNGKMNVANGVIQRGGAAVTATNDLGLYSQMLGHWVRLVSNAGPIAFFNDAGAGTNWAMFLSADGKLGVGRNVIPTTSQVEIAAQDGLKISGYQPYLTLNDTNAGNARSVIQGADGSIFFYTNEALSGGGAPLVVRNDGHTAVKVLEITGADLAEKFPASEKLEPGMVVEIDPDNPGKLRIAKGAYNRRVAGVVSGANGLSVGAVLGNLPGHEDAPAIALSGRVYVHCDAADSAIQPGDLLTTSATPGFAMKALDPDKATGAVLGKAMTGLEHGKGLVLVLVSLQ